MTETTTCTRCNAECLDYRQEGHDKLCLACTALQSLQTCQFTHETRAGYCVTHQERLRSGVCVTGRAMQELWEALSPTPPQPADETDDAMKGGDEG